MNPTAKLEIQSKRSPASLLSSELELLLSHVRHLELTVQRVQATACVESSQLQNQHQAELAELQTKLAELLASPRHDPSAQKEAAALQAAATEEIQRLKRRIDELEPLLDERQTSIGRAENELTALKQAAAGLDARIAQLQSDYQKSSADAAESAGMCDLLGADIAQLNQQLATSREELERHHAESARQHQSLLEELQRQQQRAAESLTQARGEAEKTAHRTAEVESALAHETSALNALRTASAKETQTLREQVRELQRKLDESQQASKQLDRDLAEARRNLESLTQEIQALRADAESQQRIRKAAAASAAASPSKTYSAEPPASEPMRNPGSTPNPHEAAPMRIPMRIAQQQP